MKTLKDMPRYMKSKVSNGTIDYDELNEEAIKWVKWYRNNMGITSCYEERAISLIDFFNITEEDLK